MIDGEQGENLQQKGCARPHGTTRHRNDSGNIAKSFEHPVSYEASVVH